MSFSPAQLLPLEILLLICQFTAEPSSACYAHGGRVPGSRWNSNELVCPLALVCRSWSAAAMAILYESVCVLDHLTGYLFLRTIEDRPPLAQLVRWAVLGLNDPEDTLSSVVLASDRTPDPSPQPEDSTFGACDANEVEAIAESLVLGNILTRCGSVRHLQIRGALHHSAREVAMSVLHSRSYDILICAPQLHATPAQWGDGFYEAQDALVLAAHTRWILELECVLAYDSFGTDFTSGSAVLSAMLPPPVFELRRLRLACNLPPCPLSTLIGRAHKLEHLDVYTEKFAAAADAFSAVPSEVKSALVTLKFIVNPDLTQGLPVSSLESSAVVGSFLSRLSSLVSATVSSAELSPATLLQSLPSALRTLEIIAIHAPFGFHPNLLLALRDRHLDLVALTHWRLVGSDWTEDQVDEVTEACKTRQIAFE